MMIRQILLQLFHLAYVCIGWSTKETGLLRDDSDIAVGYNNESIWLIGGSTYSEQIAEYRLNNDEFINHGQRTLGTVLSCDSQSWTQSENIIYTLEPQSNPSTLGIFNMNNKNYISGWKELETTKNDACLALSKAQNYLFVVGGSDSVSGYTYHQDLHILNLSSHQWLSNAPPMNQKRGSLACLVHNDNLWAFGGFADGNYLKTNERIIIGDFDTSWNYVDSLTVTASGLRAVSAVDMIYIIGGRNGAFDPVNTVHIMNPISGTITLSGSLLYPLANSGTIVVGTTIYLFGGTTFTNVIFGGIMYQVLKTTAPTPLKTTSPTRYPTAPTSYPTTLTSYPTASSASPSAFTSYPTAPTASPSASTTNAHVLTIEASTTIPNSTMFIMESRGPSIYANVMTDSTIIGTESQDSQLKNQNRIGLLSVVVISILTLLAIVMFVFLYFWQYQENRLDCFCCENQEEELVQNAAVEEPVAVVPQEGDGEESYDLDDKMEGLKVTEEGVDDNDENPNPKPPPKKDGVIKTSKTIKAKHPLPANAAPQSNIRNVEVKDDEDKIDSVEHVSIDEAKARKGGDREKLLNDDDFVTVFGVGREEFYKLPKWKQVNAKKSNGLF